MYVYGRNCINIELTDHIDIIFIHSKIYLRFLKAEIYNIQFFLHLFAESNSIFRNFLRRILKICLQVMWICQMKRDSVTSLVHNNLFRALVMTTGCVLLRWIQWYFWKFSTTIIKDLCSNTMNLSYEKKFPRLARS